jgi:Ca2+-binding RTX toxin-like protein
VVGAGDDTLNGMGGADTMIGGLGTDHFYVDDAGDQVIENAGEGTDWVHTAASYVLGANVENLFLTGTANINGTGNALNNVITGNSGNNVLTGGAGGDTLSGGLGADTMDGGTGDDYFVVDNAGDGVVEQGGGGTDWVQSSISYTLPAFVENLILTGSAQLAGVGNELNNSITGNIAANDLSGGAGNDTLNGGIGDDTMRGGTGNDIFVVDNAGDDVIELSGEGIDTVHAALSYTLAANVEYLQLTGTANINGTGNAGINAISGNSGNNVLDGGAGGDTMYGGDGNDVYIVNELGDQAIEFHAGGGTDHVMSAVNFILAAHVDNLTLTGTGNVYGIGNDAVNILTGNSGNNVLSGGAGADTMEGGLGNDTYVVDDAQDVVTEAQSGGTDSIESSISFTLAANVEYLVLTGTANINGTGNALDNQIYGNSGDNVLNGGGGADSMFGGAGNDHYHVDLSSDAAIEISASGGTDTVTSSASAYTIGANIEILRLEGGAINGTGNELDNQIYGGSGDNVLTGGLGADRLEGLGGNDVFAYRATAESTSASRDTIMDFNGGDKIDLSAIDVNPATGGDEAFTYVGTAAFSGAAGELRVASAGASQRLVEADTNGDKVADLAILVTTTDNHILTASDFIL